MFKIDFKQKYKDLKQKQKEFQERTYENLRLKYENLQLKYDKLEKHLVDYETVKLRDVCSRLANKTKKK